MLASDIESESAKTGSFFVQSVHISLFHALRATLLLVAAVISLFDCAFISRRGSLSKEFLYVDLVKPEKNLLLCALERLRTYSGLLQPILATFEQPFCGKIP